MQGDEAREDDRSYSDDTNGTVDVTHVKSSPHERKCALSAATRIGAGRLNPYPSSIDLYSALCLVAYCDCARRSLIQRVRPPEPFRGHILEHGAGFWIGRRPCQLQTMGGLADIALSVVD